MKSSITRIGAQTTHLRSVITSRDDYADFWEARLSNGDFLRAGTRDLFLIIFLEVLFVSPEKANRIGQFDCPLGRVTTNLLHVLH